MGKRKINFLQRIGYILEYIIVVPLGLLLSLIPFAWINGVSRMLGPVFYRLNKKDRKWAYYNLGIIYKDNPLTKDEQDKIVKKLYCNILRFGLEYLKMGRVTAKNYHKYAEFVNFDETVGKLQKEGKGVICVTLHLGNWELLGGIPAKTGTNLAVVINRQWNPYTDIWLKNIRVKKGKMKAFYNEISEIKNIARHLKGGGVIALVADQTYYFKPLIIPFFDTPCGTADGPAKFHLKFDAPIVMCYSYMADDGKYRLVFEDPVTFEKSGDMKADLAKIMTWVNKKYEGYVLEHIDQWFSLLHPRWERRTAEEFEELDFDPF